MRHIIWFGLLALGCNGVDSTQDDTDSATDTDTDTDATENATNRCDAPLVTLQTGKDDTCAGGNTHQFPIGMPAESCHGWGAQDNSGNSHENSASAIQCNVDGSFSFTQYAGNLTCSGEGVSKTFFLNECEQDIPPSLYTLGVDFACCIDPEGQDCLVGVPTVSVPAGIVYLDGDACDE